MVQMVLVRGYSRLAWSMGFTRSWPMLLNHWPHMGQAGRAAAAAEAVVRVVGCAAHKF